MVKLYKINLKQALFLFFITFAHMDIEFHRMKKMQLEKIFPLPLRKQIAKWIKIALFMVAVITMGAIVIDYGFEQHPNEWVFIQKIYHYAWWIYCISYAGDLIFQWKQITRKKILPTITWGLLLACVGVGKFITLPPSLEWLGHHFFEIGVVGLFSALEISRGLINIVNKRSNPALLMAGGFALIIAFGTLLLLLPRSTHEGIILPIVDALFVSTSAVCVTGLTPVDVAQVFTLEGQIVIALLIQIGGLGVMTITSFFALFFMGGSGLSNQFALRDLVGSDTLSSLLSTLLYILFFTFMIEGIGALLIWLSIHGTLDMTIQQEIFFSVFHAISAFCNAGFSTLSGNLGNPAIMTGHNAFYLIISALIVLGGIGFPILMNFRSILFYRIKGWFKKLVRRPQHNKLIHLTRINTKIVLTTTTLLIVGGSVTIGLLEWNGAFKDMPTADKIVHSIFNAISPRTAGFNSIDLTHLSLFSILLYMLLMWIGGGAQSTAGGIKVNTLAVMMASFVSVIRGRERVVLFNRELSENSIKRASAVVVGSVLCILIFFIAILALEPQISPKGLLFETISAFGTVGSSLNVTPLLGNTSKVLITLLMFIGRVGFITLMMSFVKTDHQPKFRYPKDNVIIN